jgi:hypothetical protein
VSTKARKLAAPFGRVSHVAGTSLARFVALINIDDPCCRRLVLRLGADQAAPLSNETAGFQTAVAAATPWKLEFRTS